MKTLLSSLLVVILLCSTASAQQPVRPSERFPESIYVVQDGIRFRAFSLENFVELLQIDADLVAEMQEVALLEAEVEQFRLQTTALTAALSLSEDSVRLITEDRTRLTNLYRTTNQRLHEVENKPNFLGITGWVLSALLIGATVSLGIIVGVN